MKHRLLKLMTVVVCLFCMGVWQSAGRNPIPTGFPDSTFPVPEGEEEGAVSFVSHPNQTEYLQIYNEPVYASVFARIEPMVENLYVRFQPSADTPVDNFTYGVFDNRQGTESSIEKLDAQRGFWYPQDLLKKCEGDIDIRVETQNEGVFKYSLQVYSSLSLEEEPLISIDDRTIYFEHGEQFPRLNSATSRLSGELGEEIPLQVTVTPGFMLGKAAKLRIEVHTDNYESSNPRDVVISGNGIGLENPEYNDARYVCPLPACEATTYTFQIRTDKEFAGWLNCRLEDEGGAYLASLSDISVIIPMQYSEEDIAVLKEIADDNPLSTDLRRFIDNEYYLKDFSYEDGYNVGVKWSRDQQSRVTEFMLNDYEKRVEKLDALSDLGGLTQINLSGTGVKHLNLAALSQLYSINLDNTPLFWDDVDFPVSLSEDLHIHGMTRYQIGTPLDDYNSVAANGTEIDLSKFAEVEGQSSTYQWYKVGDRGLEEVTMPAVPEGAAGKFLLTGTPGERYLCQIKNPRYGDWAIETSRCKITRSPDQYAQADIDGLKKLAAANPQVHQLQEFVESKGWETDNWESYQDVIRTDWSSGDVARLTHLLIELDWGEKPDSISSLDLSAFTEL